MSKKIKPEQLQDLTTDELRDVVEGAIVEILGDELIVVESPEQVKLVPPVLVEWEEKVGPFKKKVFEFKARGHNHNQIGAMLGVDSEMIKVILEGGE
jgi:hypothetical protein